MEEEKATSQLTILLNLLVRSPAIALVNPKTTMNAAYVVGLEEVG